MRNPRYRKTTWAELTAIMKSGGAPFVTAGYLIRSRHPNYEYNGGDILVELIEKYKKRFGNFPNEAVGDVLCDKAYKEICQRRSSYR